jgi:hypothetical protein
MADTRFLTCVRLPPDVVLTPRVLSRLICKLETEELRFVLESGHDELDRREGDPDLEPGADREPEPEMDPA